VNLKKIILLILFVNYRIECYIKHRSIKNFIRKVSDCYGKVGKGKTRRFDKKSCKQCRNHQGYSPEEGRGGEGIPRMMLRRKQVMPSKMFIEKRKV